jgi:hypothetical protein
MAEPGKLKLTLLDVERQRLRQDVEVVLQHQTLRSADVKVRLAAGKSTVIAGLRPQPDGVYRIEADPLSYLPVTQFVVIKSAGVTTLDLTFPVDPRKVKNVVFPDYPALAQDARRVLEASDRVLLFEDTSGSALYAKLDDIRRAGFLNVVGKTLATAFDTDNRTVLSYVEKLTELRGDRFFPVVRKELREEAKNAVHSGRFVEVPELLHHPPDGFTHAGSYKTTDRYGNLQLTFFVHGDDWRADIDIDDAGGVQHVFQVLRNALTGEPTHPYNVHELLVYYQKLNPQYTLLV